MEVLFHALRSLVMVLAGLSTGVAIGYAMLKRTHGAEAAQEFLEDIASMLGLGEDD